MIFSPLPILNILALISTSANGVTYEQMKQSLYLNNNKTLTANLFHKYNEFIQKNNDKITLSIANQIYINDHYTLNKTFQGTAAKNFSCGIESMNFSKNIQAAQTINDFVTKKTHYKIKNFIHSDSIDDGIALMLISTIYFKGDWETIFSDWDTTVGDFYVNENEMARVDFMKTQSNFGYKTINELEASVLEMKYTNSKYSFIIILPWSRTGLSKLETKLKNFDLTKLNDLFKFQKYIEVIIPKFKAEMSIKLNDILQNVRKNSVLLF